jgi:hypothetical protein
MNDTLVFILSLSIGLAGIIGIVRFKQLDKAYYPFIYNIWAAFALEIILRILMIAGLVKPFLILYNVYTIIDFYLFFRLFYNWKLFGSSKRFFYLVTATAFIAWASTTFFAAGFFRPNYYFPVLYSFTLVFFSVTAFNKLIVHERGNILTNARFWICIGVIIFYTFFILINTTRLTVFHFRVSKSFQRSLQDINVYSNLLVNLMYAIAVLWIPRKKNFTSLF